MLWALLIVHLYTTVHLCFFAQRQQKGTLAKRCSPISGGNFLGLWLLLIKIIYTDELSVKRLFVG
jgi:hypothetical protein